MANVNLTIPDAFMTRTVEAFTKTFGYQENIPNPDYDPNEFEGDGVTPNPNYDPNQTIPNDETEEQFTKKKVGELIKQVVTKYEVGLARQTSRQTIAADVDGVTIS